MNNDSETVKKLDQLTALRFFAAIIVVFHHLAGTFAVKSAPLNLGQGVSFFFVLSGFILTYVYPRFESRTDLRRFFAARWARLWPAYLTSFLIGLVLTDYVWNFGTVVAHLTMVQAWIPLSAYYFSYNGVAWSVSTELFFYFVFPLLILFRPRAWSMLLFVATVLLLLWLLFVQKLGLPDFGGPGTAEGLKVTQHGLIYISPVARIFEFAFGMVVARFWQNRLCDWSRRRGTAFECGVIALCVLSIYGTTVASFTLAEPLGGVVAMWLLHSGSFFAFGLLVYVFANGRGWISFLLAKPVFVILGEISFSVYLIHNLFIGFYNKNSASFYWLGDTTGLVAFITVLIASSYLIWACVEQPSRKILKNKWRSPHARKGVTSPTLPRLRNLTATSTFVVMAFCGFSYFKSAGALSDHAASEMTSAKYRDFVGAKFADAFELRGVSIVCRGEDMIARFVWKKTGDVVEPLGSAVHIIDDTGKILGQADYKQDEKVREMRLGTLWIDNVLVRPTQVPGQATAIALGIYEVGGKMMKVDHTKTDWDGHRLVLPFERCQAK